MAQHPGPAIISHPAAKLAGYVWSLKLRKLLIYEVKAHRRLLTSLDLTPPQVYGSLARNIQTIIFHLFARSEGGHSVSSEQFLAHLSNIFFKETRLHDLTQGRGRRGQM